MSKMANSLNGMKVKDIIEMLKGYEEYTLKLHYNDYENPSPFPTIYKYVVSDKYKYILDASPSEQIVIIGLEKLKWIE